MKKSSNRGLVLLYLLLIPLILTTGFSGYKMYNYSTERGDIKEDMSHANSIAYGLLSVNSWKDKIKKIIIHQIDSFELTDQQDSLLREQISQLLNHGLSDAQEVINNNDKTFKKKMRKWAVKAVVDWEDLHRQVPQFTQMIMSELKDPETKDALKKIAASKFEQYASQTFDNRDSVKIAKLYSKYGENSLEPFNEKIQNKAKKLQLQTYNYAYLILSILGVFLLLWFLIFKYPALVKPFFVLSVALGIVILITGLLCPMIEIDARIEQLDFTILGESFDFDNQMLYYRSKSILQVVGTLLKTNQWDGKGVGILILIFSVLLPFFKLLSSQFVLFGKEKLRSHKVVHWLAYNSGKWSMADVIVVAIFMAYVAFDGILDDQLKILNMESESISLITTNDTALQAGFILFTAFVLYSLILSEILKRVNR